MKHTNIIAQLTLASLISPICGQTQLRDAKSTLVDLATLAEVAVVIPPDIIPGELTAIGRGSKDPREALDALVAALGCQLVEFDGGYHRLTKMDPATNPAGAPTLTAASPHLAARIDDYTIRGDHSFLSGYPALHDTTGTVNVVVEIPTGTTAKWEVDKHDGALRWEFRDGSPRVVQFLGYPENYGMIPRTLLPKSEGGDGDPVDVIVLGDPLPRGSVVAARLIGVLELEDGGEQDDKLIAVRSGTPFAEIADLPQLRERFPGVIASIQHWFEHYKGPGEITVKKSSNAARAAEILTLASQAFDQAASKIPAPRSQPSDR